MLRPRAILRHLSGTILAAVALFAVMVVFCSAMRPDLRPGHIQQHSAVEIAAVEEARSIRINRDNPVILHRDVDYSQGKAGRWYPKGEAPILADLVADGSLPPVAERVGPEPCVTEGVEGIGKHGGSWIMIVPDETVCHELMDRSMTAATLLRWSPQGLPRVPHIAKSFTVSPDNREFIFELREGMKWSDGQPFTADDILYWWEHEATDPDVESTVPPFMTVRGKPGNVEKLGPHTVKFSFPHPYGLFPTIVATRASMEIVGRPKHYLEPYHPTIGDKKLIAATMKSRGMASPKALYRFLRAKENPNPEYPRLWPWVYHTYKTSAPQIYVRNPYYFVVDPEGNQLPYIDRVVFQFKAQDLLPISIAAGGASHEFAWLEDKYYTLFMEQRKKGDYDIQYVYPGGRNVFVTTLNMNLLVDPAKPETAKKLHLFNDKRFRQAMSLAINRDTIIQALYHGKSEPAQVAPGPDSFFHEPSVYKAFVEHDPDRAQALLDEIGLTRRDYEGYRTFPDGSRLTIHLHYGRGGGEVPPFLIDDWAKVGIRVIPREQGGRIYFSSKWGRTHDMSVWGGWGEFFPMLSPQYFVPFDFDSDYAIGYGKWYQAGGLYGDPRARHPGCIEPPPGHPLRRAMEVLEEASSVSDLTQQRDIFREALKIAAENTWSIGIATPPPGLWMVKNGFRNVPKNSVGSFAFLSPSNCAPETYFLDRSSDSPGAIAATRQEIMHITPPPDTPAAQTAAKGNETTGRRVGQLFKFGFLAVFALLVLLVAVRHPYIARRLLIMVPTLLVTSVVTFTVIQLPPGDFLTSEIVNLRQSGLASAEEEVQWMREAFYLDDPPAVRYLRWAGFRWFVTYKPEDKGLLQGNLGRCMSDSRPVNQKIGDRLLLTVLISLGTILFTWALAIPIGIYSAVRQYSLGDYVLTFLGFIGMCIPGFLLALLLMYASAEWLGFPVSGLFSSQYAAQPEWDLPKVRDLLQHIWVPVAVLGVNGTAIMVRVMRANLLDELKRPYVVTARAKGLRPMKLLFKYPVRLAINPFISGIGSLFPALVSGEAIVAIVLSLPTIGPLMLQALMDEDLYLAGALLMLLSLLGVLGTLVSDLLLLWLDPRIRFEGGSRQ